MRLRFRFPTRKSSFLRQLIVTFVSGIICLSLLSSLAISTLSYRIVRERSVEQGMRATQSLAEQMTLALLYFSPENADPPARSILAFPDVRGVAIYKPDHSLLLGKGEPVPEPSAWPQEPRMERDTERAWCFVAPVFAHRGTSEDASPFAAGKHEAELIGFVGLVMGKDTLKTMEQGILWTNLAVSGGFALVFLFLLLIITRRLTTPLNRLAQIMGRASAGEKKLRAEIRGPRDIVEMETAFNSMMDVLENRERQLEAARDAALETARVNALVTFALNHVREAAFLIDQRADFHYVNDEACNVLGYGRAELLGLGMADVDPDFLPERWPIRWDEIKARHSLNFEGRHKARDGRVFPVEIGANYLEYGGTAYSLALARDITERKQAEEELERHRHHLEELVATRTRELAQARDAADAANRAKSAFLANMSHELRTPLNAILGFAQIMERDERIPPEQRDNLGVVNRSGRHLLALINDVLEISRIEAGRLEMQPGDFDLRNLLVTLLESQSPRARDKRLELRLVPAPDLPRFVRTDAGKLRQVLLNLVSNAVKYTERGEVELSASAEARGQRTLLRFAVRDTGVGIAADDLEKVFLPFYQAQYGTALGQGTGLGLAISRDYARLMGGSLTVESAPERGSIFRFEIPVEPAEASVLEPTAQGRVVGLVAGLPPYRVLVVEDHADNRRLLEDILRQAGFQVSAANDGEQAVRAFQSWHPDFIWMDMRMPGMDGYEATRRIRALPGGDRVRIVALTASAFVEDRAAILAAGCDEVLSKPLEMEQIFAAMEGLLGVRYRYAEPEEAAAPVDLSRLPAPLRGELGQAADCLDIEATAQVIGRIRAIDGPLATELEKLARDFRFDRILALLSARV